MSALRTRLRHFLTETLPWRIAWWIPRRVAYFAFVRVYSITGECGPEYDHICQEWERRA